MIKENIIKEKYSLVDWSLTLKNISNDLWFKPFREGSWGTADVIAHFISWDKFLIEKRIYFLLREKDFPKTNVTGESINQEASKYARSGISKEDLISEFIYVRKNLVTQLGNVKPEKFDQPCPGKKHITLCEYFVGMIDHDLKHKEQIETHIKKYS
ncbi:DinB family protein [Bacillus sp. CHD6a]|uniref:DinB family protein n=1 Tax=Bacillus sp. CHD6a TaxID=1643452 RepID=UPI0006CE00E0|nr:DinB family protein [Bacillus sp. CHD6a]KPB03768.1 hypothetical protein AAV98_15820 [Bacillus sp. CHD6a]